ncbi:acetyl-CoA synthetase-like protein [Cyathus striatus]|nr:acetyl-CoA synthetase-like protein [Cyathus striatus]
MLVPRYALAPRTSWKTFRRHITFSAVQGPTIPPLSTKTLTHFFNSEILEKHGHRPALICRMEAPRAHGGPPSANMGRHSHLAWDFGEFDRHINSLARGLLAMGVQKGDRVGVIMGNNSAYAMLQWACASIGAILVTINPAYRLHELVATLNLVGVKHLFVVPRIRSSAYVNMLAQAFPEMCGNAQGDIQIADLPNLRNLVVVDNKEEYRAELEKLNIRSMKEISESAEKDEVINLQFTSGTTASTHDTRWSAHPFQFVEQRAINRQCMYLTENDVLCNVPPLFHCFDKYLDPHIVPEPDFRSLNTPLYDPVAIVDIVVEEKCTALHGVPTHFLGVLAEVDKRRKEGEEVDLSRLRTGIAAGSPIPIDLMKSLISKMNLTDLTNAYGMTETSPVSFQTTPADPIIKRVETVGKVQPHVKAKLVDSDGNVVPIGTPGEILISGYLLQKGYWDDEDQTNAVMKTDADKTLWMYTGDEGIMDEEGYVRIVGRKKDIIIRGGENLFPVQIENALTAHPEIREAAAVAVRDSKYGEVVGAWIVRETGSKISREEVRRSVSETMNPQNAPAWVWFMNEEGCPDELPKTASGKVMKHILRDWSKDFVENKVGRADGK